MSGKGYIAVAPDKACAQCGKIEETRPYGKFGEELCFTCAMKDEDTAVKRFRQHVLGEGFDS